MDPIMCVYRPYNQIVATHMSDRTKPEQIFNFCDDDFICFLDYSLYQPATQIAFLSRDKKKGDACVILMAH